MKYLVTGANGFVGKDLCTKLVEQGNIVLGAVRRNDVLLGSDIDRVTVGEINNRTDWSKIVNGVDVVIHLAARVHVMNETSEDPLDDFRRMNVNGTEHLARAASASGVKRFVFVSSIKVNGEYSTGGNRYTEFDIPSPIDPYGISKWEAEQCLHRVAQETGMEVVIVRPPLVYGEGVKGNFAQMINLLDHAIPLPLASIRNLRSLIYIGNLVDALMRCAEHPSAAGKTYLVSDNEDVSTPELLRQLGDAMGSPVWLFPWPIFLLKFAGRLFGRSAQIERLLGSLKMDSSKIRRELDWQPAYSLQQGLKATADWYRNARH